jgi:hypothetical protein
VSEGKQLDPIVLPNAPHHHIDVHGGMVLAGQTAQVQAGMLQARQLQLLLLPILRCRCVEVECFANAAVGRVSGNVRSHSDLVRSTQPNCCAGMYCCCN